MASESERPGLILGFDLDQTLIDSHSLISSDNKSWKADPAYLGDAIRCTLNYKLIDDVVIPAIETRGNGVDAILLLTNNGDEKFVHKICSVIVWYLKVKGISDKQIKNKFMFDDIMTRNNKERDPAGTKSMYDIEIMIGRINRRLLPGQKPLSTENLLERTYFFDDNHTHVIKFEMETAGRPGQYYLIKSNKAGEQGFNILKNVVPENLSNSSTMMCEDEHTDVTEYAGIKVKLNLLKGRIRGWGNAKRQETIMKAAVNNSRKRYNAEKERVQQLRDEMEKQEKVDAEERRLRQKEENARREASAKIWLGHSQPYAFKPYPFAPMPKTIPQANNVNSLTNLLGQQPPLYSTPLKRPGRNTFTLPPRREYKPPLTSAAAQYLRSKYQPTYQGGRKTKVLRKKKQSKRKTRRN
jgi:hypothetical protein